MKNKVVGEIRIGRKEMKRQGKEKLGRKQRMI